MSAEMYRSGVCRLIVLSAGFRLMVPDCALHRWSGSPGLPVAGPAGTASDLVSGVARGERLVGGGRAGGGDLGQRRRGAAERGAALLVVAPVAQAAGAG